MKRLHLIGTACLILVAVGCRRDATPRPRAMSAADSAFRRLTNAYFRARYEFYPTEAVGQGFHEYDDNLERGSAEVVQARIDTLKAQRARLAAIPVAQLSVDDSIDAAFVGAQIQAELLDLDTIRWWVRNPTLYIGLVGGGADQIIKRDFAPPAQRLASLTARLLQMPALLADMRTNVQEPPKEFTDLAIRVATGSVGFFKKDVATWAKEAAGTDTAALRAFTTANDSVIASLGAAAKWLTHDLKPKSTGQYAIGPDRFLAMLRANEMVDFPLDTLLAIGEATLAKDRAAFLAVAKQIDSTKRPEEVMRALSSDHPAADALVPWARATIEGTRQFLVDHRIVTVPSEVRPTLKETPPYARNGAFASMDTPGAFETKATEAYYYVTPPERDWDAKHIEEHLRLFNRPVMDLITIHEAFPGHYLQFLYASQFPTKVRKLLYASSNAEGWAHYSEQMMIEQGFGGGDLKLRLAQLGEALLRDCRFVTGIRIHTQPGWTVDRAAKELFVDRCFQEPANGYEEARRGAYNPTYLYYTLGKLMIYKLREDYQRSLGTRYTLQGFHDAFVRQGSIPLPLIRRILLPGNHAPLL